MTRAPNRPCPRRIFHLDPLQGLVALRVNERNQHLHLAWTFAAHEALQAGSSGPLARFRRSAITDLRLQRWPLITDLDELMAVLAAMIDDERRRCPLALPGEGA